MNDFWNGFAAFFDFLLIPFEALRELELSNWWLANIFSWILILITFVAFVYWMLQLREHDANNEEDKSISSHSFL